MKYRWSILSHCQRETRASVKILAKFLSGKEISLHDPSVINQTVFLTDGKDNNQIRISNYSTSVKVERGDWLWVELKRLEILTISSNLRSFFFFLSFPLFSRNGRTIVYTLATLKILAVQWFHVSSAIPREIVRFPRSMNIFHSSFQQGVEKKKITRPSENVRFRLD